MKIIVGNDLTTGAVVWWSGAGWSHHVGDAIIVDEGGPAIIAAEEAARRVALAFEVEAIATPTGLLPAHIKDRIRAAGPTVHPAFAIHPELPIKRISR